MSTMPNLKELCLNQINRSSLEELGNQIVSSTIPYRYQNQKPLNSNEIEVILAKALRKRPQDLPRQLIQNFFEKIIKVDDQQKIQSFLKVFKSKFFKNNEKKYTRSIESLFSSPLNWYDHSHFESLKNLFSTGIDPNIPLALHFKKMPIIHHALIKQFPADAIEWMLDHGVRYDKKNTAEKCPLFNFLQRHVDQYPPEDATKILGSFLRNDVPPFICNSEGTSALEFAYRFSQTRNSSSLLAVIEKLLERFGYQKDAFHFQSLSLPYPVDVMTKRLQDAKSSRGYTFLPKRVEFDKTLIEEGLQNSELSLFKDTDVEIVSDNHENTLKLNQMTHSEAAGCQALFNRIKKGTSCFKWQSTEPFSEQVQNSIKKLLTRPSGRALVCWLVKANRPLFIIENHRNNGAVKPSVYPHLPELISVDFSQDLPLWCLNSDGIKEEQNCPLFLRLGHELLHSHLMAMDAKAAHDLVNIKCSEWSNLHEQFVITGLEGDALLCENMLRFEFGESPRCGH